MLRPTAGAARIARAWAPAGLGIFDHSGRGCFAIGKLDQAPEAGRVVVAGSPAFNPFEPMLSETCLGLRGMAKPPKNVSPSFPWRRSSEKRA